MMTIRYWFLPLALASLVCQVCFLSILSIMGAVEAFSTSKVSPKLQRRWCNGMPFFHKQPRPAALLSSFAVVVGPKSKPSSSSSSSLCLSLPLSHHQQVGAVSWTGLDPNRPQKVNQDVYFHTTITVVSPTSARRDGVDESMSTKELAPGSAITFTTTTTTSQTVYNVVGVMDGHGRKAERLTDFLSTHLPFCIEQQFNHPQPVTELEEQILRLAKFDSLHDDVATTTSTEDSTSHVHQVLRNAFHQAHWDAMQNKEIPAGRCGTTCIVCVWNDNDDNDNDDGALHVAHVGDSRAYRFLMENDDDDPPQALTTPTTVQNCLKDRQRIEKACEGRVDDNGNVWYGPIGIAMTRALGDSAMLRAGVIPTPVTQSFSRARKSDSREHDRIVLATDGIWDVLSVTKVQEILRDHRSFSNQEVAEVLASQAKLAWAAQGPGFFDDEVKCDDITCLVFHL